MEVMQWQKGKAGETLPNILKKFFIAAIFSLPHSFI
jgi:hypothetical protein